MSSVLSEVYCSRCSATHEAEVDEAELEAQRRDANPIERMCGECQRADDLKFDVMYPHLGCCGSKDGK